MSKLDIDCIWTDKKRTIFGLPISFTRYFITETKFITRKGFFNLVEDEINLYKVTDKKFLMPLSQRIIGCSTIVLYTRDCDTPTKEIKCIKNARNVLNLLDKQITKELDRYRIRGKDMIGAYADDSSDDCDDLGDNAPDEA